LAFTLVIKDGLHVMPLPGDKTRSVTACSAFLLAQNVSVEMKLALPRAGHFMFANIACY
jgi:hypothetical protein